MKTSSQNTKGGILVTAVLLIAVVTMVIAAFYEGLQHVNTMEDASLI